MRRNQRRPFVISVSPDEAFPVASVIHLINDGTLRGMLSDNPVPQDRPDLARFYTGKVAYRSERARRHKHWILAKELLTVRSWDGRPDPTIYIARHGRTEWNTLGRRQGRLDSPLTAEGTEQAHRLARLARDRGVRHVYCSPLNRAVQTAMIVARELHISPEVVDNLIEMDFGALQGELVSAEDRFPAFVEGRRVDRLHTSYPGGESYFGLSLRTQPEIDRIAASSQTSLVVGHGSVNRMMLPFLVDGLSLADAATRWQPSDLVIGVNLVTRTEEHITLDGDGQ